MALKKLKTLDSGVTGDYFKITLAQLDKIGRKVMYHMDLFLNEANKNSKPLDYRKYFTFDLTTEEMNGNIVAIGYIKIKSIAIEDQDEEIIGATDA